MIYESVDSANMIDVDPPLTWYLRFVDYISGGVITNAKRQVGIERGFSRKSNNQLHNMSYKLTRAEFALIRIKSMTDAKNIEVLEEINAVSTEALELNYTVTPKK